MNDVNMTAPNLKLVRGSEQASARASTSPQADRSSVAVQQGTAQKSAQAAPVEAPQVSLAEKLDARAESQREQLDQAVSRLNDFVQTVQRDLQFEVNNDFGRTIVRVIDQSTQQVIRQIPDDVALRLAENLQQDEPLTLFNIEV